MAKKKRRTAIVPRVVFSVAMGVSVVPSLIGCGSEAAPATRTPAPTRIAPTTVIAAVAVTPPPTTTVAIAAEPAAEIDAGPPPEPQAETPPPRRRRPEPTAVDRHRLMGVALQPPRDWELLGVAVQAD